MSITAFLARLYYTSRPQSAPAFKIIIGMFMCMVNAWLSMRGRMQLHAKVVCILSVGRCSVRTHLDVRLVLELSAYVWNC